MSGGIAYVWARDKADFRLNCNLGMVELERVETEREIGQLLDMVDLHWKYTGSPVAENVLADWDRIVRDEFVKVMPVDYKRALSDRMFHNEEEEAPVHAEKATQPI